MDMLGGGHSFLLDSDEKNDIICSKCGKRAESIEYVTSGPRQYVKYIHKFASSDSNFYQSCYVRISENVKTESDTAMKLSREKENFLDSS
jgi:hypothetical protein